MLNQKTTEGQKPHKQERKQPKTTFPLQDDEPKEQQMLGQPKVKLLIPMPDERVTEQQWSERQVRPAAMGQHWFNSYQDKHEVPFEVRPCRSPHTAPQSTALYLLSPLWNQRPGSQTTSPQPPCTHRSRDLLPRKGKETPQTWNSTSQTRKAAATKDLHAQQSAQEQLFTSSLPVKYTQDSGFPGMTQPHRAWSLCTRTALTQGWLCRCHDPAHTQEAIGGLGSQNLQSCILSLPEQGHREVTQCYLHAKLTKGNKLHGINHRSGPVQGWNPCAGADRPSPPTCRDILVSLDLPGTLNTT